MSAFRAILLTSVTGAMAATTFAPTARSAETSQNQAGQVEEVVVTAQRRNQNLQNVPVTVAAVSGEELEAKHITSTGQLAAVTPGLVTFQSEGFALPHLRGVGTNVDANGISNPVATYIDDVYIDAAVASLLTMNNVEQVEVDKGPQGTLFGRNATGGVIQVRTKDPSSAFGGEAAVGMDNYQTFTNDLYLTGGLTNNVAANFALHYSNQADGYGKNRYSGQDIYKGTELDLRAKLLWTPTDRDKIKLTADYERMDDSYNNLDYVLGTLPFAGQPARTGSPWDTYQTTPQPHHMTQYGIAAKIQHRFDFGELSSITAYRSTDSRTVYNLGLPPADVTGILGGRFRQLTQEFQLSSPSGGWLKWNVGAFFMHSVSEDAPYVSAQSKTAAFPHGLFGYPDFYPGEFPEYNSNIYVGIVTTSSETVDSGALYGQATAEIFKDTNLTLGLRYTMDTASIHGANEDFLAPPLMDPTPRRTERANQPTWRIALDHQFTPDVMAFISYNRGFKAGTFNNNTPQLAGTQPETLDAYEVGVKSEFMDRRVRINASGFYYQYSNIVLPHSVLGVLEDLNGPDAVVYGADVDVVARVTSRLRVTLDLEYLESKFTTHTLTPFYTPNSAALGGGETETEQSVYGNKLPLAPNLSSTLSVSYRIPTANGDVDLDASWYHSEKYYAGADNLLAQPAYDMISAEINWTLPNSWRLSLWGQNLANELVYARIIETTLGQVQSAQPPRTFGARLRYKF